MYTNVTDYVAFCKQSLYIFNETCSMLERLNDRGLQGEASIEALLSDKSPLKRPI